MQVPATDNNNKIQITVQKFKKFIYAGEEKKIDKFILQKALTEKYNKYQWKKKSYFEL